MSIDPLAEKYSYQSPYNFAENRVVDSRELEGLEALHHTMIDSQGNKSHVLEKNAIILTQNKLTIPSGATEKQIAKIERKNERIVESNNQRVEAIKSDLNSHYNLDGKGEQKTNSAGENVTFKFNITTVSVDDTTGKSGINGMSGNQFSFVNGLQGESKVSPATIFSTNSASATGSASGQVVDDIQSGAPEGTYSHEMFHTMGPGDNGYTSGGILNSPPESLKRTEIDDAIKLSVEAKK